MGRASAYSISARAERLSAHRACKIDLPEGFQTSEFLLKHGFVDRIVHRSEMRSELARLIDYGSR